ncbi:MAG: DUF4446 family protein [Selenomonadaceae bacterium]|nr:DUF4446 family protein [Selenomonadaceae bacterium]
MGDFNAAIVENLVYVFIFLGIVIGVMIGFIISLETRLSDMKKRYRKMLMSDEDDANAQQILLKHAEKINSAVETEEKLNTELTQMKDLLTHAISRVAVVRFNAFQGDTAELSYCIALLDAENSGVIISSLNGREFTRSYVKPIVKGESEKYKLTKEEEQALRDASTSK